LTQVSPGNSQKGVESLLGCVVIVLTICPHEKLPKGSRKDERKTLAAIYLKRYARG